MTTFPEIDRRALDRIPLTRPCKLHDPATGKYYPGTTHDLTDRSVLLTVERPLLLRPGQRITVGIAMLQRQGLIHAKEMMEATVVRTMSTEDGRTVIAAQFVDIAAGADTATRAAA